MEQSTLFKPNQLIAAIDQVKVTRLAKHLGNFFLQHAQKLINDPKKYKGENQFSLPISYVNELAGVASKDYNLIQKSLKALITPVTIRDEDPEDIKNDTKICYVALVSKIIVDSKNGLYTFKLEDEIIDLLKRNQYFTKLNLVQFNGLESKHSIVLYEWLLRYETNPSGIPQMSIEDLRIITKTADKKSYDNFSDIQRFILDVAVGEINEKTPHSVAYEAIKERAKRRPKVSALRWTFKRKEDQCNASNTSHEIKRPISLETPLSDIHAIYEEAANRFVEKGFCEAKADFYKATYYCDLGGLELFYKTKMNRYGGKGISLRYLLEDIKNGTKPGRRKYQIEFYNAFVSQLPKNAQDYSRYIESSQGFLEQIHTLKSILKDTRELEDDLEKWL